MLYDDHVHPVRYALRRSRSPSTLRYTTITYTQYVIEIDLHVRWTANSLRECVEEVGGAVPRLVVVVDDTDDPIIVAPSHLAVVLVTASNLFHECYNETTCVWLYRSKEHNWKLLFKVIRQ